jgi:hypothetical protein
LARKDSASSSWSANGSAVPFQHCLPAKQERDSQAPRSHRFSSGAMNPDQQGNVRINMSAIRDRKRKMVAGLVDMHLDIYKKTGTELVMGSGRFVEIAEPILEFDVVVRYQMLRLC